MAARGSFKFFGLEFTDVDVRSVIQAAPWAALFASMFAILAVTAWGFSTTPTAELQFVLSGLGLAAPVADALGSAHSWMVAQPRADWIAGAVVVLIAIAAVRFIWGRVTLVQEREAVKVDRLRLHELEGESLRRRTKQPRREPALPLMGAEAYSDEQLAREIASARGELASSVAYLERLREFEAGVRLRATGLWWVCAALALEVGGWAAIGFVVASAAWLVAVVIEAGVNSGRSAIPQSVVVFLDGLLAVLLALPMVLVRILLHPIEWRDKKEDDAGSPTVSFDASGEAS